jgi:hypothetical protein
MHIEQLFGRISDGKVPHGFLFAGLHDNSLREAALQLAKALFCAQTQNGHPCNACMSCKKVLAGQHADVRFVEPESRETKIDQIRDFQRWLNIFPNEAKKKVGVVIGADNLNLSCANALLKTLEEPPAHAVIVLIARNLHNILATIRSRLMLVRFPSPQGQDFEGESPPMWIDQLQSLIRQPRPVSPEAIFELTQVASKHREELPFFFETMERALVEELRASPHNRKIGRIFEETVKAERDVLGRYDNVGLAMDHLLLEWLT